jgi:iron complex outermembrane receptor protein
MKSIARIFTLSSLCFLLVCILSASAAAQATGAIEGTVTLPTNGPAHRARVLIVDLGRAAETDEDGRYRFDNVPPGTHEVVALQTGLDSVPQIIEIAAGGTGKADILLRITPIRTEITVTATGREETAFQAVQSVTSLDAFDLSESISTSIGEVLDGQTGIAKRSFGTGSARPVIRGFDGDRVLVMQDGVGIGSLGSQSGDHSEPIDPSNIERLEVLRGPATLLYGSNAIGGVVNAISSHQEIDDRPHQGVRGQMSSGFGSTNNQAGGSFNTEIGVRNWMLWVGGGGQRTADYDTPAGIVENSKSRISNGNAGFGWFGNRGFASIDYKGNDGRYGIPFANEFHGHHHEEGEVPGEEVPGEEEAEELEAVDLAFRRHNVRFTGGFRNLGSFFDGFKLSLNYSDWNHDEVETFHTGEQETATTFENQQFSYRGVFTQGGAGALRGSFGFQGAHRSYETAGEESLSPPVDQNSFAVFALEQIDFERIQLQFGGRIETNRFKPLEPVLRVHHHEEGEVEEEPELVQLPNRNFTGASVGIGSRFGLWQDGALVANFTSSFRSPALEELYNFGPHVGNLAFEVGDENLVRERSNGFDLSLRHQSGRIRGEANFFYYDFDNFVYLAPSGEVVDGLTEADFIQDDAHFLGTELKLAVGLHDMLWLNLGMDAVNAELTGTDMSLPRIPPLRGRVGLDLRYAGLSVKPEVVMADARRDVFSTETATAGYAVMNLTSSYTVPRQHFSHHFSVNFFNVGDRLYRNHVSFIKDLAPEIGRGVRLSYAVKFF